MIHSTGFFRMKAKNIRESCQQILKKHDGKLPQSLSEMVSLPGVGRKTANVVLGNAFGIVSGVVVDTHVKRLSLRLGWTRSPNVLFIERELMEKVSKKDWILLSHLLIHHGRGLCKARVPQCHKCFLQKLCPHGKTQIKKILSTPGRKAVSGA